MNSESIASHVLVKSSVIYYKPAKTFFKVSMQCMQLRILQFFIAIIYIICMTCICIWMHMHVALARS